MVVCPCLCCCHTSGSVAGLEQHQLQLSAERGERELKSADVDVRNQCIVYELYIQMGHLNVCA